MGYYIFDQKSKITNETLFKIFTLQASSQDSQIILSGDKAQIIGKSIINPISLNAHSIENNVPKSFHLIFNTVDFFEPVIFNLNAKLRFDFINCRFHQSFTIQNKKGLDVNPEIKGCTFLAPTEIDLSTPKSYTLSNLNCVSTLTISGHYNAGIELTDINSNKEGTLLLACGSKAVDLTKSNFERIEINSNSDNLYRVRSVETNVFQVKSIGDSSIIDIANSKIKLYGDPAFNKKAKYSGSFSLTAFESIEVNASIINHLAVVQSNVESISIHGILSDQSDILIDTVYLKYFHLFDLNNFGKLQFRNISMQDKSVSTFKHVDIGNCKFISCDFTKSELYFDKSNIISSFLWNVAFPRHVGQKSNPFWLESKLFASQIHTIYTRQGETVNGLEFQSREVEAHYEVIRLKNNEFPFINFTKINLFLNKWSNDFGRAWGQGLLFTLGVAILFFYALVVSTEDFELAFSFDYECRLWPSFLKFFNPLRSYDGINVFEINKEEAYLKFTGWSYFWDILGRIFIAYGYYQTIQAFRRFGRK